MHTTMANDGRKVTFGRPVIGPRHYVSVAGGGWTETFSRIDADRALQTLIGRLKVSEMVDNFLEHMRLADKSKITWSDITLYLGRIMRVNPDKIPMIASVAFWAEVTKIEDAKESN